MEGYNGRLDALQAGLLTVKLRWLPGWNARRREIAARYNASLAAAGDALQLPYEPSWAKSIYHLYVIGVKDREGLRTQLSAMRIGVGIHYPIPLHLQKAYQHLGYGQGSFPVSERAASEILSLPMYPQLAPADQELVATKVCEWVKGIPAPPGPLRMAGSAG
jgi:dTDP-4-amino-4,6-dideoxygalactose transaminase